VAVIERGIRSVEDASRTIMCVIGEEAEEAAGEANREWDRHFGKHAQPARPQVFSGGPAPLPRVTQLGTLEAYICRK
jgi:hypothetical protein